MQKNFFSRHRITTALCAVCFFGAVACSEDNTNNTTNTDVDMGDKTKTDMDRSNDITLDMNGTRENLDCESFLTGTGGVIKDLGDGVDYIVETGCLIPLIGDNTLTIEPGVTIVVEKGPFAFYIGKGIFPPIEPSTAKLVALGTAEKPILIQGVVAVKAIHTGIHVSNNASAELDHLTIVGGGITMTDESTLSIKNSRIEQAFKNGIEFLRDASMTAFENNVLTKNPGYPISIAINGGARLLDTGSTFVGNERDYVSLNQSIGTEEDKSQTTLVALDVPYYGAGIDIFGTLALSPGVDMVQGGRIRTSNTGVLEINGTTEAPVVLRSETLEGAPSEWNGLRFTGEGRSSLNNVIIKKAVANGDPALHLRDTVTVTLRNVSFEGAKDPCQVQVLQTTATLDIDETTTTDFGDVLCP